MDPTQDTSSLPRPPRQSRSRASMDRVLAATEELLEEHLLEELTLADILGRARVSVGSFYARFGNRDALVPLLHDRYDERLAVLSEHYLAPERWAHLPLERRVALLVRLGLRAYRRHRGLLRALVLEWRTHPERITDRQREHRALFHGRLEAVLLGDGRGIRHPDPVLGVRFAMLAFGSICRELLLQGRIEVPLPMPAAAGDDHASLGRELTRLLCQHLTGPASPGAPPEG